MAYADLLINTATIQRHTVTGTDEYGQPVYNWANHLPDEPCRLMDAGGREIKVGAEVVIADYKLFLRDVDITEQDRVVIDTITYEVLLVELRQNGVGGHHKECYLKVVR